MAATPAAKPGASKEAMSLKINNFANFQQLAEDTEFTPVGGSRD
jgi:hypothetical protein